MTVRRERLQLSDRQWEAVQAVLRCGELKVSGGQRDAVAVLLERVLTGTPWSQLSRLTPCWQEVLVLYQRWQASGVLSDLSRVLNVFLDDDIPDGAHG